MAEKIRAIVKRPDEPYGHVTNISNTLKNLQKIVEGPIEVTGLTSNSAIICNEEGKLQGLERNFIIKYSSVPHIDIICGDVVIVGIDGEDFCDCPLDFSSWKALLKMWGN